MRIQDGYQSRLLNDVSGNCELIFQFNDIFSILSDAIFCFKEWGFQGELFLFSLFYWFSYNNK